METTLSPVTTSKQFSLKLNDFWKGLLMAVGTPVIAILLTSLNNGSFDFNWKLIGTVALSTALMYLGKNFFTPSAIVIKEPDAVKAIEEGKANVTINATTGP